ncbi:MAG: NAD(P)/FAD-dependent oxidoreductase [Sulfolobales archaeon]
MRIRTWLTLLKIAIIGAGPSGLTLARLLSDLGYNVVVYESMRDLAVKPCGWGVPDTRDIRSLPVSKEIYESVIWDYEGYRVYIDGKLLFENKEKRVLGYIIDKRVFLKKLSEGLEVRFNTPVHSVRDKKIIVRNSEEITADIIVNASGFYGQKKNLEKILAIQYHLEGQIEEPEIPELYFNSQLVGYAWVFPESRRRVRVGIGGYGSRETLESVLVEVILSRKDLREARVVKREGALVTVSGIDWSLAEDREVYHIGESIGSVMPATGEGIRPSIYTSIALYNSLKTGDSYKEELRKIRLFRAMEIQRRILDLEVMSSPETRKRFLINTPEEILIKISLGEFTDIDLLKLAMKPENIKMLISILRR